VSIGGGSVGVAPGMFGGVVGPPVSVPPPMPSFPLAFVDDPRPGRYLPGREPPRPPLSPADEALRATLLAGLADLGAGRTDQARLRFSSLVSTRPSMGSPAGRISALATLGLGDAAVAELPAARANGYMAMVMKHIEAQTTYSSLLTQINDGPFNECTLVRNGYATEAMAHLSQGVPNMQTGYHFSTASDLYEAALEMASFPDAPCRRDARAGRERLRAHDRDNP
jgi:hypothetical protein